MSRLWDTPEYWARSEADEMLREMADADPATVADAFERSAANYDGEPEMATAIIADLRRRAAAGIRFWPGPQAIDSGKAPEVGCAAGPIPVGLDVTDDEIPW
jgi:hypothetical protein